VLPQLRGLVASKSNVVSRSSVMILVTMLAFPGFSAPQLDPMALHIFAHHSLSESVKLILGHEV
jgi:hypothetical protein